jgi:sec-independent protein translocase protein TatA
MLAMFGMGVQELVIIGIVGVLLFGSQLPKVAHSLGKAIPSFKKGIKDVEGEIKEGEEELKKLEKDIKDVADSV